MKRILAALSLALLAAPVFADDRAAPYEQTQFDRGILDQRIPHGAAGGASTAAPSSGTAPWASDWNFVAPPQ